MIIVLSRLCREESLKGRRWLLAVGATAPRRLSLKTRGGGGGAGGCRIQGAGPAAPLGHAVCSVVSSRVALCCVQCGVLSCVALCCANAVYIQFP